MDEKRVERLEDEQSKQIGVVAALLDWRNRTDAEIEALRLHRHATNERLSEHVLRLRELENEQNALRDTVDQHSEVLVLSDLPKMRADVSGLVLASNIAAAITGDRIKLSKGLLAALSAAASAMATAGWLTCHGPANASPTRSQPVQKRSEQSNPTIGAPQP